MADPVIEIRRIGPGFVVVVSPPDLAHPPQPFDTIKQAFGYAGGLRIVTGWRKSDLTGE
jgi:hypothetical protein